MAGLDFFFPSSVLDVHIDSKATVSWIFSTQAPTFRLLNQVPASVCRRGDRYLKETERGEGENDPKKKKWKRAEGYFFLFPIPSFLPSFLNERVCWWDSSPQRTIRRGGGEERANNKERRQRNKQSPWTSVRTVMSSAPNSNHFLEMSFLSFPPFFFLFFGFCPESRDTA